MALHWVFGLEFVVVLSQKMMMRENTGRFLQLRGKLLPFFFFFFCFLIGKIQEVGIGSLGLKSG